MKAAVFTGFRQPLEIRDVPDPKPGDSDALGISATAVPAMTGYKTNGLNVLTSWKAAAKPMAPTAAHA